MTKTSKELTAFIRDVNKGIVDAMFMKVNNPTRPDQSVLCIMDGLEVSFDVRVNAGGHVTHGQDVAAKLHFKFCYTPEKLNEDGSSPCPAMPVYQG